jgi:hypothetical protein
MNLEAIQQKIRIRIDKNMWDVLSGQIVMQRRTSLPVLTIGNNTQGTFNSAAKKLLAKMKFANFYKLSNGMLIVEFSDKEGLLKLTRYSNLIKSLHCLTVSITKLKKYIFNDLNNKKYQYHFYLHPTDRENTYVLKELTNSWE